jgi:hypothetical protein
MELRSVQEAAQVNGSTKTAESLQLVLTGLTNSRANPIEALHYMQTFISM